MPKKKKINKKGKITQNSKGNEKQLNVYLQKSLGVLKAGWGGGCILLLYPSQGRQGKTQ